MNYELPKKDDPSDQDLLIKDKTDNIPKNNSVYIINNNNNPLQSTSNFSEDETFDLKSSLLQIISISLPTTIFYLSLFGLNSINLSIAGKIFSQDAIDAVGVSNIYITCLMLSWTIGIFSGFETLGPNAYAAGRYRLFGLYLQRAQILGNIFMLILLIIHLLFAKTIISLFVANENVITYVSEYINLLIIATFFDCQFSLNFKYLNIIGKSYLGSIIIVISLIIHFCLSNLFVHYLNYGIAGLGYSLIISNISNLIMGSLYIYVYSPVPDSIFFYNKETFENLGEYLRIAVPGCFLISAQWTATEIISLLAIWIGQLDYTVHIIITNLWLYSTVINNSIVISVVVIIGKQIALNKIEKMKKEILTAFAFGISIISLMSIAFVVFRKSLVEIYTNEKTVIEKSLNVMLILAATILFDYSQYFFNSICRGLNKFVWALVISISNFWILQILLTVCFGKLAGLGVFGIWLGILIGCSITLVAYVILISNLDLNLVYEEVKLRLDEDREKERLRNEE